MQFRFVCRTISLIIRKIKINFNFNFTDDNDDFFQGEIFTLETIVLSLQHDCNEVLSVQNHEGKPKVKRLILVNNCSTSQKLC